jgi:hypothetical protein
MEGTTGSAPMRHRCSNQASPDTHASSQLRNSDFPHTCASPIVSGEVKTYYAENVNRISARDLAIYGFLILGLLRMAGLFVPDFVNRFARTLAVSPSPNPFVQVRSFRGDPLLGIWIECRQADGNTRRSQWGPELRSRLRAPGRVSAFYAGAIDYFDSENHVTLAPSLLSRLACTDTAFARATGCGPGTSSASLSIRSVARSHPLRHRDLAWTCGGIR